MMIANIVKVIAEIVAQGAKAEVAIAVNAVIASLVDANLMVADNSIGRHHQRTGKIRVTDAATVAAMSTEMITKTHHPEASGTQ